MSLWQTNRLKRINLLEGSVSSGKTWISLVLWAFWVKTMPEDKLYMMCAKSLTTLKRNCLILLQELVGEENFTFSISAKEGLLFGRRILFEGANDSRSESKIRGLTLQGAYCDELTQFPRDFFTMLLSRLRLPNAKLIATTNPDSPSHWLKTDYIDRQDELSMLDMRFLIGDNTTLPKDYVDNLKIEYTGVFYDRFICGLWVLAEGLIYPMYEDAFAEPPESKAKLYALSIDYGTMNAFAATLWGKYDTVWWAVDEYYYSGRDSGRTKTDDEYYSDMEEWLRYIPGRLYTVIDPSAASYIALLRKNTKRYNVRKANNDVLKGIEQTAVAMQRGIIKFSPKCRNIKREFEGYVWDNSEVEDRPVKVNDHAMDSIRYFVATSGIAAPKTQYKAKWD